MLRDSVSKKVNKKFFWKNTSFMLTYQYFLICFLLVYVIWLLLFFYIYLFLDVRVFITFIGWLQECRDQRTTWRSWFSSQTLRLQGLNLGHQSWWKVLLPTKQAHQLLHLYQLKQSISLYLQSESLHCLLILSPGVRHSVTHGVQCYYERLCEVLSLMDYVPGLCFLMSPRG